jgi:hypothetical protein
VLFFRLFMARLYQTVVSPRSTGGTGGPRFRCPSPRLPKRITPLSADLAAHGRTRTLALQKLHRICLAEVRTLKARHRMALHDWHLTATTKISPEPEIYLLITICKHAIAPTLVTLYIPSIFLKAFAIKSAIPLTLANIIGETCRAPAARQTAIDTKCKLPTERATYWRSLNLNLQT